jgi:hypothetical protein
MNISPVAAISHKLLSAPFFKGDSWNCWRACLRAAFAESMRELFTAVAACQPPQKRVRELVIAAGRGAGKDSIASLVVTCAAFNFDRKNFRPGEKAVCMALACDREQANVRGYFETVPALSRMVDRISADSRAQQWRRH